jgi:hypothetical protein
MDADIGETFGPALDINISKLVPRTGSIEVYTLGSSISIILEHGLKFPESVCAGCKLPCVSALYTIDDKINLR